MGTIYEPLDEARLKRLATTGGYISAEPFAHVVIDDLFNPMALEQVLAEWPDPEDDLLEIHNDGVYVREKFGTAIGARFGPSTDHILGRLGRPDFLSALEQLTHIAGLIPDPYFFGGGLHFTRSGGRLAVHTDFNKHFKFGLDRRLNMLIYLNKDWTESNGGWLELWDRAMTRPVQRILPIFNRTVIFSTTDFSFHGQPEEITGPPDLFRRSIALYYYSNGRPAEEISAGEHSTVWKERPVKGF